MQESITVKSRYPNDAKMVIYQIRNKINGKSYVGQASGGFRYRYQNVDWWSRLSNEYLDNAVKKYGPENFEVLILESGVRSLKLLNVLEIFHIERLNCVRPNGYNFESGGRGLNQKKPSPEYIEERQKNVLKKKGIDCHRLLNNKTGKIHEFYNIERFARENRLSGPMLTIMLSNKRSKQGNPYYSRHREWSLPDNPIRKIECTSATGEKEIILDGVNGGIKGFCKRHGFQSTSNVFATIAGKFSNAYGWTFKII